MKQEQKDKLIWLRQLLKQNAPSFYEHYKKYKLKEPNAHEQKS